MTAVLPHVRAALGALASLPVPTFWGGAPRNASGALPARPYLVAYPDAGLSSVASLSGHRDVFDVRVTLTAVGDGPEQVADWADRARSVLLAATITVSGRANVRLMQIDGGPGVQRDDDLSPPLWYQPVTYRLSSTT